MAPISDIVISFFIFYESINVCYRVRLILPPPPPVERVVPPPVGRLTPLLRYEPLFVGLVTRCELLFAGRVTRLLLLFEGLVTVVFLLPFGRVTVVEFGLLLGLLTVVLFLVPLGRVIWPCLFLGGVTCPSPLVAGEPLLLPGRTTLPLLICLGAPLPPTTPPPTAGL